MKQAVRPKKTKTAQERVGFQVAGEVMGATAEPSDSREMRSAVVGSLSTVVGAATVATEDMVATEPTVFLEHEERMGLAALVETAVLQETVPMELRADRAVMAALAVFASV
jgi:hypothetical protein